MAEIPYYFETPVPKYFREKGWFDDENTFKFVTWAFSKCSTQSHVVILDRKEVVLGPFEFVAGRLTNPQECYLTEKQFRGQLNSMISGGFLKKGANSKANRYTTYIWVTERFTNSNGQQKGQQRANSGPTKGHNQEEKKTRSKESHHPNPSSKIESIGDADHDGLTDDFSFANQEEGLQHNVQSQTQEKPLIPICEGVSLTQAELDDCIKIKGSLEKVKHAIEYIMRAPGRKRKIHNWPNALSTWEIKSDIKPRLKENEEMAKRLVELYGNNDGYRCDIYNDRLKDQRGLLFSSTACVGNPEQFFIPLTDAEFKEKCSKIIRDKKMQKARISKS